MGFGRGLDIRHGPSLRQVISGRIEVPRVGILGRDLPGLRPGFDVAEGDRVARGDPIMHDRRQPELRITAPASGTVARIDLGARRRLSALVIDCDGDAAREFDVPATPSRASSRKLMQDAGLWMQWIARPFGHVPDPDAEPDAIFVMATDPWWGAADPRLVIEAAGGAFDAGIHLIRHVADVPVHICQPPGAALARAGGHVRIHPVVGPFPQGLAGTEIDRVAPIRHDGQVWQIGYDAVLALGVLAQTGCLPETRVVALGGPLARDPRLVELPPGADLGAVAATEAGPGPRRILSGPAIAGAERGFLGLRARQVSLMLRDEAPHAKPWLPLPRRPLRPSGVIPHVALDHSLGPGIPSVPLLRALSVGDLSGCQRLGARALLEEDLAALTYLTGGTEDFGQRLRHILDRMEAEP